MDSNQLPKDTVMLLSVVNTKLRDHYSSLSLFCADIGITEELLNSKLNTIDYFYDEKQNQYI